MGDKSDKWINKFQRISWEPEMLIAGGLLFTLLLLPEYLVQLRNYLYPFRIQGLNATLGVFTLGISGLTIGFAAYLVVKSLWFALLALKVTFPKGINLDKLKYSQYFTNKINLQLSFDDRIQTVGKYASQLFALSFLLLLIFFGLGFYMLIVVLVFYFNPYFGLSNINYIFLPLIILLVDFVTLGVLKKNTYISKIYFPLYKILSILTLSFLYRDMLYAFISNVSKYRIYSFTLIFLVLTAGLGYRNVSRMLYMPTTFHSWDFYGSFRNEYWQNKYDDERSVGTPIRLGSIQSFKIEDDYIKLYLRYRTRMDFEMNNLSDEDPDKSKDQVFKDYFNIKIDDTTLNDVTWLFTRRLDINQYGVYGIIQCNNISKGIHELTVSTLNNDKYFSVPFWKE